MKSYDIHILYCLCLKCCGILSQLYVSGFHLNQKNLCLGDQSTLIKFLKPVTSLSARVILYLKVHIIQCLVHNQKERLQHAS